MNKTEIEKVLKSYGCNDSVIGFNLFVEVIILIINDIKKGEATKYNYKLKNYYSRVAIVNDFKETTIASNILNAVTRGNRYGDGLTPKELVDIVLAKLEEKRV